MRSSADKSFPRVSSSSVTSSGPTSKLTSLLRATKFLVTASTVSSKPWKPFTNITYINNLTVFTTHDYYIKRKVFLDKQPGTLRSISMCMGRYLRTDWDNLMTYGASIKYITDTLDELRLLMKKGKLKEGQFNFLTYLLSRKELSEKDVITITLSLFSDGLSTTAPTLLGNLHCLSLNPESQERLYNEIIRNVSVDAPITVNTVNKLHYLKAFVKEVFRLSRDEAIVFITEILKIDAPTSFPPTIEWINLLVQTFQQRLPFQNITLLSQDIQYVPSWEDINRDVIKNGKGGLCLSLNVALAAILSALNVTAYNAAADYIPTKARGVHVVTIIDLSKAFEAELKCLRSQDKMITRSKTQDSNPLLDPTLSKSDENTVYIWNSPNICSGNLNRSVCPGMMKKDSLYLADVGCGFPTLQVIHLKEDLNRVFVNCGLEYCIIKKGRRFVRMHRRGHEADEGEEDFCVGEVWLPIFSFNLIPRDMNFFKQSLRRIYVNKNVSPYFEELHCVIYLNTHEMIAIKNNVHIQYLGRQKPSLSNDNYIYEHTNEVSSLACKFRKILSKRDLIELLHENFACLSELNIERAVSRYFKNIQDVKYEDEDRNRVCMD
ncbi:hypothetical protein SK128_013937 [Halocaridina rubra]|uniref:Arylamine N-acetyltransferase n=1 Tax=Halocaridina rubra TaxID=373956 RepID=A0AAN9A2R2_HALRR